MSTPDVSGGFDCIPDNCPECPNTRGHTNEDKFLPYGTSNGDTQFSKCDDCSEHVVFTQSLTFFGTAYNQAYISSNGHVSFAENNQFTPPSTFHSSDYTGVPCLSAYWTDLDLLGIGGELYYRQIISNSVDVDAIFTQAQAGVAWVSTWSIVVTFDKAGFYAADCVDRSVTFQTIISGDANGEFNAVFIYGDIEIAGGFSGTDECIGKSDMNAPVAGFNDGKGNAKWIEKSMTSDMIDVEYGTNCNVQGVYIFRVDEESPIPTSTTETMTTAASTLSSCLSNAGMSGQMTKLQDHGCHCPLIALDSADPAQYGGAPVDDIDAICRDWLRGARCLRLAPTTCAGNEHFSMTYTYGVSDQTCALSDDSCEHLRCESHIYYSTKIMDFFAANSSWQPMKNSVCVRAGSGVDTDTCCLSSLKPYDSNDSSATCDNGFFYAL